MSRALFLPLFVVLLGAAPASTPAQMLWQQGQAAMTDGQTDRAIACYKKSLEHDPGLHRNFLSLAAAYLEKADDEQACLWLERYVKARPDHLAVRLEYAELLQRLQRVPAARAVYEGTAAELQEREQTEHGHLLHCHSRLMEIAEAEGAEFDEHLHRGIGLFVLADQCATAEQTTGELKPQGLLCKAAGELTAAHNLRPEDARVCWYLHQVWSRLGQRTPAQRWLRTAEDALPFSQLTPAEARALHLACRQRDGLREK